MMGTERDASHGKRGSCMSCLSVEAVGGVSLTPLCLGSQGTAGSVPGTLRVLEEQHQQRRVCDTRSLRDVG